MKITKFLPVPLCVLALILQSNISYAQTFRYNVTVRSNGSVTAGGRSPIPNAPEIRIGKKPLKEFTDIIQKTIDGTGKIIPEEIKKSTTKLFGESAKLSGDLIEIYRTNQNKISNLTLQGLDLYQQIYDPISENVIKLKDGTFNAIGVKLPDEIDKALDAYINQNQEGFNEVYNLYKKTLEIEDQVLDGSSASLKEFAKYLLLTTNGYPTVVNCVPLNKQSGIATLNINANALQAVIDQLIKDNFSNGDDHSKPFQVISVSSGTLKFDNNTNSLILELNDAKIRHNQPTGFSRISATLNIRKLKLQILPNDNQDGSITFKTKLYYLDVEDLLPKLDEMLCWIFEEKITSKISMTFNASELINSKLKIEKSNIGALQLSTSHLKSNIFITEKQLGIVYKETNINTVDTTKLSNSIEVKFNEDFIKTIVNKALDNSNGVKISIDKKAKKFDETRNHIYLTKIKTIKFNPDGSLYIGAESSVHFRKFLGNRPKINVLFSNVGFNLTPTLITNPSSSSVEMVLVPVIDSLIVTGNPIKSKVLRKIAKFFKKSKTPIVLDAVAIDIIKSFNFVNPLNPESVLLPKERELKLIKETNDWKLVLDFK